MLSPDMFALVLFRGPFGSGKTTMINGIVNELTGESAISPSFVLVHEYRGKFHVYHCDFYRLKSAEELKTFGFSEYLESGVVLVEWPENVLNPVDRRFIEVQIEYLTFQTRRVRLIFHLP
jgi:tRNA threonylcarbamoyladenosine biosynthesis protein TsaE